MDNSRKRTLNTQETKKDTSKKNGNETFASMDLYGPLKKALADQNYITPTPIQSKTIPPAVAGNDILGCAQTGTGKTAAFALPILDYIAGEKLQAKPRRPLALVLAPTRELAIQIADSFKVYGKHTKVRHVTIYGGVNQNSQVRSVARGSEVMIATPGRLIDLMDQGHIDLSDVEQFVLDEADRMLDMGFLPALKQIVKALPKERQSLFFSATLAPKIRELASELLFNPISVDVTPKVSSVTKIKQTIRMIERSDKVRTLEAMLVDGEIERAIVFTRTKRGANALASKLDRAGIGAVAIHGNKSQNARQRALDAFKKEKIRVLVATDVAARGIDIDGVTHVVNFDMPVEPESYVHRIGRTGRAGASGVAISFCTTDEIEELRAIEKEIKQKLVIDNPKNLSMVSTGGSKPRSNSRSRHGGNRGGGGRSRSGGGGNKRGGNHSRNRKSGGPGRRQAASV
jgi:ATP-dependent RNA helicase RhlE